MCSDRPGRGGGEQGGTAGVICDGGRGGWVGGWVACAATAVGAEAAGETGAADYSINLSSL